MMKNYYNKGELTKEILTTIALMGMVVTCAALPGMAVVFKWFMPKDEREKQKIRRAVMELDKRKVIRIYRKNGEDVIEMLEKGKKRLLRYKFDDIHITPPKWWDKKWRIVIFDFPSRYEMSRKMFRYKINQLGFFQYQKSVFIIPYECKDEVFFVASYLHLERYVKYIVAESIDDEAKLKNIFHL